MAVHAPAAPLFAPRSPFAALLDSARTKWAIGCASGVLLVAGLIAIPLVDDDGSEPARVPDNTGILPEQLRTGGQPVPATENRQPATNAPASGGVTPTPGPGTPSAPGTPGTPASPPVSQPSSGLLPLPIVGAESPLPDVTVPDVTIPVTVPQVTVPTTLPVTVPPTTLPASSTGTTTPTTAPPGVTLPTLPVPTTHPI